MVNMIPNNKNSIPAKTCLSYTSKIPITNVRIMTTCLKKETDKPIVNCRIMIKTNKTMNSDKMLFTFK